VVTKLTDGIAGLFEQNGVTRYAGAARLDGPGRVVVGDETHEARHVILATGSRAATLPGVEMDGDRIGDSTAALSWPEVPRKLVVIGAGYIGLELGSVWSRLGAEVTVVEFLKRILPGTDGEIARVALQLFKRQGLDFRLGAEVTGATVKGRKATVTVKDQDDLVADRVLVAVGRRPVTEGLRLESAGVELTGRGFVKVDGRGRAAEGIWAVGDVAGGAPCWPTRPPTRPWRWSSAWPAGPATSTTRWCRRCATPTRRSPEWAGPRSSSRRTARPTGRGSTASGPTDGPWPWTGRTAG